MQAHKKMLKNQCWLQIIGTETRIKISYRALPSDSPPRAEATFATKKTRVSAREIPLMSRMDSKVLLSF